uniref:Uncharacterized protein n=1 Tax=Octactis speculum TaxID=3111310 RepID=A0A7S2C6N2_9STRA|mmetsp:Transcript_32178/g.43544  ORF Transcript_32178/g.43544 Transcript_32178/m.43544 type:complete len:353 (+) Transcript_32178:63-1121(+)|eukprot:CAMPEP_0185766034 /NCGR_PEP_ID=MMETSP1174-20130828/34796_1 /TAXON_ID=35687 /ORGANISM="Dictyocha speculum, Strain CCMP1381" /LENGTH=352 /DNA_ID=CAMNT_0028449519 /DNA_START=63 /DNA_END=1121 /DNA_ORIENTATION=-
MGCGPSFCRSKTEEEKFDADLSRKAKNEFMEEQKKIKLLLLGAGESGKSTIFKQMKILYGTKASDEEMLMMRPIIHGNILVMMKTLVQNAEESAIEASEAVDELLAVEEDTIITPDMEEHLAALWKDPGIKAAWEQRSSFQVVESIAAFMDHLPRVCAENYIPTEKDILLSRVRTSGILTEKYQIEGNMFEMYDVGGQKNERKKWIHCFEDVTAVIFVVALSEYDQSLFEDTSTNRMSDALELYDVNVNTRHFQNSSVMLFLNKCDLFEKKVDKVPIQNTPEFSDFLGAGEGKSDYDAGVDYFKAKFSSLKKKKDGFYCHVTCATDTSNVDKVFKVCKNVILQNNLKDSGFM